jgi:hypothetical protein
MKNRPNPLPEPLKPQKIKLPRAKGVKEVINKKRPRYEFEGEWLELIGKPQTNAVIFIWGKSFRGKTRLLLKLAKYYSNFERVLVDSLEEGDSDSLAKALHETDMMEADGKVFILDNEPLDILVQRLKRKKSPNIVLIDSWQYANKGYDFYRGMKEANNRKTFIINSHADGNEPRGASAKSIRYDAMVKIFVKDFVAFIQSRFASNQSYIIWEEGAKKRWDKATFAKIKKGNYWP